MEDFGHTYPQKKPLQPNSQLAQFQEWHYKALASP